MIQSKSSKMNRLRFESGVMTQFDKPQVVRLRVGRAILLFAAMAAVAAFLVWGVSSLRLPVRKAKGDAVAKSAAVLLDALKTGDLDKALTVSAESDAGRKALADDDKDHAKPAPSNAPAARPIKAAVTKQETNSVVDFLKLIRASLANRGVVWEQIKPLAFGGMQANVQDVRHMKDGALAVVGDVYFVAQDQIYALEISGRCCGDSAVVTDVWRCSPTGIKADGNLATLKDRTAQRIRVFMDEPMKPGERVGVKSPRIVFVPLQDGSKKGA